MLELVMPSQFTEKILRQRVFLKHYHMWPRYSSFLRINKTVNKRYLSQKSSAEGQLGSIIQEPTKKQIKLVILQSMVPFIGFGIMDNGLLILAGDAIDSSLCLTFGLSTMFAAALGNIVSDVAGVAFGTVIEDICAKLKLPTAALSHQQRQLRSVRFANQFGNALGLTIGCVIGMFPLLFIDNKAVEKRKLVDTKEKYIDSLFCDVLSEAKHLVEAELVRLFLVVENNNSNNNHASAASSSISSNDLARNEEFFQIKELWAKYENNNDKYHDNKIDNQIIIPYPQGLVGRCASIQQPLLLQRSDTEFNEVCHKLESSSSSSAGSTVVLSNVLCIPVISKDRKVIAVIQAINKKGGRSNHNNFTSNDVDSLRALASHISVSLQSMSYNSTDEEDHDERVPIKDVVQIIKMNNHSNK